jgi:glycosyltransferase involved in cell wall biosynthesis
MASHTSSRPLVSIVTPAYNEEKRIAQCIESVLGQSYSYWDYLIVNNCSTDSTLEIVRKYAGYDSRIRVITNTAHLPAVVNFNHCLRHISAQSKYSKILFADDRLFPECLERMVALAESNPSVGIVGAYGLEGTWVLWQGVPYGNNVVTGREICRQRLLGGPYVFGSATSVLFRSDLVRERDPFYNESNAHGSDSETCFELLKISDFGFVHQILTLSPERDGSMLQTSRQLNASAADILHELVVFGSFYLTPQEYKACLKTTLSKYYDFLAASLLRPRGKVLREYHRRRLEQNGMAISRLSILRALFRKAASRLRISRRDMQELWGL